MHPVGHRVGHRACGRRTAGALALALAMSVSLAEPALAQSDDVQTTDSQTAKPAPPPASLTGEWGGVRTSLRDAGVDITANYVTEAAYNVSGGDRSIVTDAGQLTFGATLDLQKLIALKGGTIQASLTYRHGVNEDDAAGLGVLQQVQEVYGRGNVVRVTQLWYDQKFANDHLDLKVGRLTQGEDFAPFSCTFMNLSFCGAPPGNLAGDYWYNWPISQWGGRLRAQSKNLYVMVGAYEVNPKNLDTNFFVGHFSGATGVLTPFEVGYLPQIGASRLPGSYKIGGWYNSADADDVALDVTHHVAAVTGLAPLVHDGRYGFYAQFQQQVTGTAKGEGAARATDHGLVLFFNATQTDRGTERTDNQIAAGLDWIGPFAARRGDDIGLAVARTNVNSRANLALPADVAHPNAEYAIELYYGLLIHGWLSLRPNVQYIVDPGGYSDVRDVVVLGLKGKITL